MARETEEKVRIIVTVPNQKVVQVRHEVCDAEHIYTMCNVKANSTAMKELSANAYKLYMYFDLNQDGYLFALSYKAVHEATGMADKTYQRAIKELIEKEYLVKSKEQNNLYIFYDGDCGRSRKVEITQRNRKDSTTGSKETDELQGKKFGDCPPKTTGEILQDSTIDNTIDSNAVASLQVADAPSNGKTYNYGSDDIIFCDSEIERIARVIIKEKKEDTVFNYSAEEIIDSTIKAMTTFPYNCTNVEAVSDYIYRTVKTK